MKRVAQVSLAHGAPEPQADPEEDEHNGNGHQVTRQPDANEVSHRGQVH